LISPPGWVSVRAMPAAKTATTPQVAEFEQSLDELEQLVVRMEKGELSLDDSLQSFERGIALYRNCQGALDQAKLRVSQLLDPSAPETAQPFDPDTP
jgi:exodeoxyribonuclease VII small subunit